MISKKLLVIATAGLLACLVVCPSQMLESAKNAVSLWLTQVFPSLFPFMAATGVLMRTGAADSIGNAAGKFMQPLFGLRGICAFPFVMGIISGYPMGAKITASLYAQKAISKFEAQSILRFCNNPGPLFVIGTVGTAFLNNPPYGYFLMFCIILSSLVTGVLFRFSKPKGCMAQIIITPSNTSSYGTILGDAITDATQTILQIGGFIILFASVIEALTITGVFSALGYIASAFTTIGQTAITGLSCGVLEMTNGAALLAVCSDDIRIKLTLIAAVLAFGGLSILAQSLAILSNVPIKSGDYILSKILNSLLAALFTYLLYPLFKQNTAPVFNTFTGAAPDNNSFILFSLLFFIIVILTTGFKFKKSKM